MPRGRKNVWRESLACLVEQLVCPRTAMAQLQCKAFKGLLVVSESAVYARNEFVSCMNCLVLSKRLL